VDFVAVLDQVIALLRQRGRLTYRTLQRQFQLDTAALEDLTVELIKGQRLAADEDGEVLVWIGDAASPPASAAGVPTPAPLPTPQTPPPSAAPAIPEAERRQLTVLFCDLVESTALSTQLDPEDLRDVVRAYQATCAAVIQRFEGHIAQYLGDGLLVYFGYPQAHEDDTQRAVRAGLGILGALPTLNTRLEQRHGVRVAVRLGIHTGLVVVGEVGSGDRQENLALGETPNMAARLQGLAAPDTVAISAATFRLVQGYFTYEELGAHPLRGVAAPVPAYRILGESGVQSRLDAATPTRLTPLVGRDEEAALLQRCWAQARAGQGQVVLLSGEAGIGKSRLVQVLKEHVAAEPQAWLIPCQCSPYYQNTALYPMIDVLERVTLRFERDESPQHRLSKLEGFVVQYGLPLAEAMPLFAGLLSLPLSDTYAPLTLSPDQQKQKTLHALLTILWRIATQQPVLLVMEDLHWVDPTTLELLTLLVDQGPSARILALWTCRPDFSPPWPGRAHLTQVTLPRLPRRQAAEMINQVTHGKVLPAEVVEQIVAKTDGVPLFVEELTKMVLEAGLLQEREDHYALTSPLPPLAIPTTLHDSLMARLDRLAAVKALAQLGATLGREFSYELLRAVAPWDEGTMQRGLHQLVEAEFLYQQGVPPQATYLFKHALIQDAAYQALLKSTRQHYHQRIAEVLVDRFPKIAATQPELVAHHYTEAGLTEQAIPYWQRAGQQALQRSAHQEAIGHLTKGLELLKGLPDTPKHAHQELDFQTALGPAWMAAKGYAAPEVEQAYGRARALCQQLGETSRLFSVLRGLGAFYFVWGKYQTAREVGEELLRLAQPQPDPARLVGAHQVLGIAWFWLGELASARGHLEQAIALDDPQQHRAPTFRSGQAPGVLCRAYSAWVLGLLGYPDQALGRIQEALTVARDLAHPHSVVFALYWAATLHQLRRDGQATHEWAEAEIALAHEQLFPYWSALGRMTRGWAWANQGQGVEGIEEIRQGLAAYQATGAELGRPWFLALLAEAYGKAGRAEEGLHVVAEALAAAAHTGEGFFEAERYRLKGELLLACSRENHTVAESCFHQALDSARHQQAKWLELRTAMSLARLWQQQGKRQEAHDLLAPIYGWFTEGFDTLDLQEAKALLDELAE